MAILDSGVDQDLMKLWQLCTDLTTQLNETRTTAAALRQQSEVLKVCPHIFLYIP